VKRSSGLMLVAVAVLAAAATCVIGTGLDHRRYSGDVVEELTYFPSGRLLKVADLGFSTLVADAMWLRGIQYYGEHRRTDREYPLAEHIFSTLTDLDPSFIGAYRFGGLVLSEDAGTPAGAIDLLRKGIRSNPEVWQIPFDLGFLYFVDLSDYTKAAHYFRFASRLKDSPEIARRFTAFAYRKAGKDEVAKALWEQVYTTSGNKMMRLTAEEALKSIETDKTAAALEAMVKRFQQANGCYPPRLESLVRAGLVKAIPPEPFGGAYFLDPETSRVLSTTKVTREAARTARFIERRVKRYQDRTGFLPQSLAALKVEGDLAEIPRVAGARVVYDPVTGVVAFVPAWEESR
jgi:hypothetical protein